VAEAELAQIQTGDLSAANKIIQTETGVLTALTETRTTVMKSSSSPVDWWP